MYKVLGDSTVRKGPDKISEKMGEFKKDEVIEVVEETINAEGLPVVKTTTLPAKSKPTMYSDRRLNGGWVKIKTSKGKQQLERIST